MRVLQSTLAGLLLLSALFVNLNSEMVDNWAENRSESEDSKLTLLGVQNEENWLVLQVEFPDNSFPQSIAADSLIGDNSAEDYIQQMTAGQSTLSVTLFDEVWQSPYDVKKWGEDVGSERDYGADGNGAENLLSTVATEQLQGYDLSD